MASTPTIHNHGAPFPFLNLPSELRNCVYRFTIPSIIRPHRSLPKKAFEVKDKRKLSIALLINKQTHREISDVLYQYSHFLIIVNGHIDSSAIRSSIFWSRYQWKWRSVKLTRRVKHIDVDLGWAQHSAGVSILQYLEYDLEILKVFRRLQTLTLRCKKYGDLNSCASPVVESLNDCRRTCPMCRSLFEPNSNEGIIKLEINLMT